MVNPLDGEMITVYQINQNKNGIAPDLYLTNMTDLILKYDWCVPSDPVDFLVGVGTGFGSMAWFGAEGSKLRVNYFPIRGEVAGMIREGVFAVQTTAFARWDIPSRSMYTPRLAVEGQAPDIVGWGLYFNIGVEVSVMFGDFTPPKKRRRR